MPDAEKTKKGLSVCVGIGCNGCPYHTLDYGECIPALIRDTQDLVGELEERLAIKDEALDALEKRCKALEARVDEADCECGQAVKWE